MQQLAILHTREVKTIKDALYKQFNYFLKEDYAYLQNDKQRVFIITKEVANIELKNLKIDKLGLYFGEIMKNGEFRLSKEGTQVLVREAQEHDGRLTNTVHLSPVQVKEYFQGHDLEIDLGTESKLVILFYNKDTLGCAKYKEGKILNFLPKIHRGEVII